MSAFAPAAEGPFAPLEPLVRSVGSALDTEAFHAQVNVAFHDAEATCYDELHRNLWRSLPRIIDRLAQDALDAGVAGDPRETGRQQSGDLRVLDVGCGTGLASALLLASPLGPRIRAIDGIDTSPAMLARFRDRANSWRSATTAHLGSLDNAPPGPYDLVITCSVLHHIPDLAPFLAGIERRQAPGGAFLHLQDPNGDALVGEARAARLVEGERAVEKRRARARIRRFRPWRLVRAAWRRIGGPLRGYIDAVNGRLLAEGVIARPMTSEELWSVTDIHVGGLPYSHGQGISLDALADHLDGYDLVAHRSYGFFGPLETELPGDLARREVACFESGETNGSQLAAAWRRVPVSRKVAATP